MLQKIIFFFTAMLFPFTSYTQKGMFSSKNKPFQYETVTFGLGSSHYFGDLAPYSYFYYGLYTNVRWNGTFNYSRQFTPKFAARAAFTYARIAGNDFTFAGKNINKMSFNYIRNFHFRNDLKEFTIAGEWALHSAVKFKDIPEFYPYISAGVGLIAHDPKARGLETTASGISGVTAFTQLRDLGTGGQKLPNSSIRTYSSVAIVFPVGFGFKYRLNDRWAVGAEGGIRLLLSDFIDDVSNTPYPDLAAALDPTAESFSYRADQPFAIVNGDLKERKDFQKALEIYNATRAAQFNSFSDVPNIYRANDEVRGSKIKDSYILTQFTISYIIGNRVKCPAIK